MSLGERIKQVRGAISQKDFGDALGVSANTLRGYENDSVPPGADFVVRLCTRYNVDYSWLLAGAGEAYNGSNASNPSEPVAVRIPQHDTIYIDENGLVTIPSLESPNLDDFYFLPLVETKLSAGGGAFALSEAVEAYYAYRKPFINRIATCHKSVILACATGNSMENTLYDGDIVMIDTGRRTIEDGRIFAIRLGEVIAIKRLSLLPNNKVMVISDNREEYAPYEASIEDIHVIGKMLISSHLHV